MWGMGNLNRIMAMKDAASLVKILAVWNSSTIDDVKA
jgi:hypothetical protein